MYCHSKSSYILYTANQETAGSATQGEGELYCHSATNRTQLENCNSLFPASAATLGYQATTSMIQYPSRWR